MDMNQAPFADWRAVLDAPRSAFSRGHAADAFIDRERWHDWSLWSEPLFTQSNGRVLAGQGANGALRFAALPTQIYQLPDVVPEVGDWPGMNQQFDTTMYEGDLAYSLDLDGSAAVIDLTAADRDNETAYYADWLPVTRTRQGDLQIALMSLAPVAEARKAALAPAPLPGPAGALYIIHLRNTGTAPVSGRLLLRASGNLANDYYEFPPFSPEEKALKHANVDVRHSTLILSRPDGAAGVHLHDGKWTGLTAPFTAERRFALAPGAEVAVETHVYLGREYRDILPTFYDLHSLSALQWLNLTASFWEVRLGRLRVGAQGAEPEAQASRDFYVRCLLDNVNCLQTNAQGNLLAHWQGAPGGCPRVWGIDVEPTTVSAAHVAPELTWQALLLFMTRSRTHSGQPDWSTPILVAPVIMARQYLEITGDVAAFKRHPEVMAALQGVMADLARCQAASEPLFATRYSSDGPVGRRYDYGTNVRVCYAIDSYAYLLSHMGRHDEATRYQRLAAAVHEALDRRMAGDGPWGRQIRGGTNLGENPELFYLPEDRPYYDGEDTASALAPMLGVCDYDDEPWANYHRWARSLFCPNFDPEFGALRWVPGESEAGALDGCAFLTRIGGCVTRAEMLESWRIAQRNAIDDVTGSLWWWPHGLEFKRSNARCSQGQGHWAWRYREQWLGVHVDAPARVLTLAPRGLLTRIDWEGMRSGPFRFDVHWCEKDGAVTAKVTNHNDEPWTWCVGFRPGGAGAEGPLIWRTVEVGPGQVADLAQATPVTRTWSSMVDRETAQAEIQALGDAQGIVFKRYGNADLYGPWDFGYMRVPGAMPTALRFVVVNGTDEDWADVTVTLACPAGWLAQARAACHWPRPDQLATGEVVATLGNIPSQTRGVAAYWLRGPHRTYPGRVHPAGTRSMHGETQPGPGLTLPSTEVEAAEEFTFVAILKARTSGGHEIVRTLQVPVRVVPAEQ